jgi:hypothetical protein
MLVTLRPPILGEDMLATENRTRSLIKSIFAIGFPLVGRHIRTIRVPTPTPSSFAMAREDVPEARRAGSDARRIWHPLGPDRKKPSRGPTGNGVLFKADG